MKSIIKTLTVLGDTTKSISTFNSFIIETFYEHKNE